MPPDGVMHSDWVLAWHRLLFQLAPWQAALALALISPVGIWLVRGLIQGLWVNPFTHDWQAANFDLVLALAAGVALATVRYGEPTGPTDAYYLAHAFGYGGAAAGFCFAMLKWWCERKYVEGWRARLGATSLYHVLVIVYLTPFFLALGVDAFMENPHENVWEMLGALELPFAVMAWAAIGVFYDDKHR